MRICARMVLKAIGYALLFEIWCLLVANVLYELRGGI